MASPTGTIYVGVTTDLEGRVGEHKSGAYDGFSKRYGCKKLVWFEEFTDVVEAITREKQIKNWRREKKVCLVQTANPSWMDLAIGWYGNSIE